VLVNGMSRRTARGGRDARAAGATCAMAMADGVEGEQRTASRRAAARRQRRGIKARKEDPERYRGLAPSSNG
jgi:hypothetical protein